MAAPSIENVTDVDAPALDVFRNLKDRTLKARDGLFIAEGRKVVRALLRSNFRVLSVLINADKLARFEADLRPDMLVFVTDPSQMKKIVGFDAQRFGVIACAYRPPATTLAATLETVNASKSGGARARRLVVVLENVNDPENIGAIVRNAAAFGADLAILGACCDPFYRRATRVSMGAAFTLPMHISKDLISDLTYLRAEHGFRLIGSVLDDQATPLQTAKRPQRAALAFGAEGAGLSSEVLKLCDDRVTIPMSSGCDSLNVGVASGVLLHHYARA